MVTVNPFAHPMAHLFIAQQARVPTLVIGDPGDGKTAIHRALCKAMARRFVLLLGSQCSPEDVAGLPVPDHVKLLCRMMPMWWVEALLTPGGMLCLDEFMSVPPSVQAALLTVIQDKLVGEVYLDVDTIICAMANPVEMTPNGTPLSLPTLNRFFHAEWKCDDEAWLDGLPTCEWEAPAFPVVPTDWQTYIPKWGSRVQAFHRRHDGMRSVVPKDDTTFSYPTRRTWENTIKCLAAADAAGADLTTDQTFVRKMTAGNVGTTAADMFSNFNSMLDLVDPIAFLDGKEKFKHSEARPDLTFCVCASITTALAGREFSTDRWDAAAGFFAALAKDAGPEIPLRYTRLLQEAAAKQKYAPSAKTMAPLVELAKRLR